VLAATLVAISAILSTRFMKIYQKRECMQPKAWRDTHATRESQKCGLRARMARTGQEDTSCDENDESTDIKVDVKYLRQKRTSHAFWTRKSMNNTILHFYNKPRGERRRNAATRSSHTIPCGVGIVVANPIAIQRVNSIKTNVARLIAIK
jgi:hypothetical protein